MHWLMKICIIISKFAIFGPIFINFSPKCRAKKLGIMIHHFGKILSFLNLEGADIGPQIWPREIPGPHM